MTLPIKKRGVIELRYQEGELDEIVGQNIDRLHFEVMSDSAIWGCIEADGRRVDVWFTSKNGRSHIQYRVTSDEQGKARRKKRTK